LAIGVSVTAIERNPVIYALVQLNLNECSNLRGLEYHFGHCVSFAHLFKAQVLYFDPMFEVLGKSAASKKNMEIFKNLVGADKDANEILQQLLLTPARRVVVKRADKAPLLADHPHHQIKSKTVRFDIYVS
jgi:hypothetical protein